MSLSLFEAKKSVTEPMLANLIEALYLEEFLFLSLPIRFGLTAGVWPYSVEKALPGVAFRKINEAFGEAVGVVQRPVETLKPFGTDSDTDKFIAKATPSRRATNDRMTMKAMAVKWIQTILYGNSPSSRAGAAYNDVDGFDGLQKRFTDAGGTQIVDNGASSGSDASSVLALRFGEGWIEGLMQDGAPGFTITNFGEVQAKPVLRTRIDAAGGMAVYHGRAGAWLKDITVSTPLSVDQLDATIDLVAGRPDVLIMSKRSRTQLRKACRTLGITLNRELNEVGKVMEYYGDIRIVTSDAMIDTETAS